MIDPNHHNLGDPNAAIHADLLEITRKLTFEDWTPPGCRTVANGVAVLRLYPGKGNDPAHWSAGGFRSFDRDVTDTVRERAEEFAWELAKTLPAPSNIELGVLVGRAVVKRKERLRERLEFDLGQVDTAAANVGRYQTGRRYWGDAHVD